MAGVMARVDQAGQVARVAGQVARVGQAGQVAEVTAPVGQAVQVHQIAEVIPRASPVPVILQAARTAVTRRMSLRAIIPATQALPLLR